MMTRLRQNEWNYVALFKVEASWPSSLWGRFEPCHPIRGAELARSTLHFKVGIPLGTERVLSVME